MIVILSTIYSAVALALTQWENHQFEDDWEDSLIIKNFSFQFVNAYIALFTMAFAEQDFNKLAYNLAIIIAAKQIGTNLLDVVMPFFQTRIKQRKLRKLVDKKIAEDPENKDHT